MVSLGRTYSFGQRRFRPGAIKIIVDIDCITFREELAEAVAKDVKAKM